MASRSIAYSLLDDLQRATAAMLALLATLGEVFDEMQEMRRAAHRRHPFIEI